MHQFIYTQEILSKDTSRQVRVGPKTWTRNYEHRMSLRKALLSRESKRYKFIWYRQAQNELNPLRLPFILHDGLGGSLRRIRKSIANWCLYECHLSSTTWGSSEVRWTIALVSPSFDRLSDEAKNLTSPLSGKTFLERTLARLPTFFLPWNLLQNKGRFTLFGQQLTGRTNTCKEEKIAPSLEGSSARQLLAFLLGTSKAN